MKYFRALLQQSEERERTRRVHVPMGPLTIRPSPHGLRVLSGETLIEASQIPNLDEFFAVLGSLKPLSTKERWPYA